MATSTKNINRLSKECATCTNVFLMAYGQSYLRWAKQRFCSKQCQGIHNRKTTLIEGKKKCGVCPTFFTRNPKFGVAVWNNQLFCSKSCAAKKSASRWVKTRIKECLICQTSFEGIKRRGSSWDSAKFCSQVCYQIEASVFMETLRYRGKENWIWRKKVLNRDNGRCQMINKDCKGIIEVHHILRYSEFPELRFEVKNGISLCNFHHPRKKVEEIKLVPFFTSLTNKHGN